MTDCKHDLPEGSCTDCREPVRRAAHVPPGVVIARYEAICVACYDDINPGDRIVHDGFEGWKHEDC